LRKNTERNQASRIISNGRLSVLPHLHLRPIEVVFFDLPSGSCDRENQSLGGLGA